MDANTSKDTMNTQEDFPVITLCGSTRFKEEFERAQRDFTLKGYIVHTVGVFGHNEENEYEVITDETKKMLDRMHKRKIELSDAICVINPGGYIGQSTESEIRYALELGKKIYSLETFEINNQSSGNQASGNQQIKTQPINSAQNSNATTTPKQKVDFNRIDKYKMGCIKDVSEDPDLLNEIEELWVFESTVTDWSLSTHAPKGTISLAIRPKNATKDICTPECRLIGDRLSDIIMFKHDYECDLIWLNYIEDEKFEEKVRANGVRVI